MFSSLLVRASPDKKFKGCTEPIVADKVELSFKTVSQAGCGVANCTYSIREDEKCLVLYSSSLIAHRDCVRQQLKITSCRIHRKSPGANSTQNLSLTNLDSSKEMSKSLPSLSSIKEQQANNLTETAGAVSAEDFVLHIGAVEAGVTLEIQLEFLVKFILPGSVFQHNFTNRMPARRFIYSATMATSLPIDSVKPLHQPSELGGFRWELVNGSSVAHIQFQEDCSDFPSVVGFSVELANGIPSGCCSLSYQTAAHMGTSRHSPGATLACDGVMMLNTSLTADQFPVNLRNKHLHPSEFVFVVDCSGSMSGSNIQSAVDTLITCIKSLPSGSYFNVIAFGSNFRQLFHTSSEYNKRSVERAIQFANQMQASLGGTEILDPLRWIFKQPRCGSLARQLFIITDGGVNNTQHVLHTVRKNRLVARCHTFGIGPEVCTELVTGIAAISGGRCVLLKDRERLQTKVMEVLTESLQPYLSDSTLTWSPPSGYSLKDSTPKSLGTLHTGCSHTAFALLQCDGISPPTDDGHVTITGTSCEEHVSIDIGPVILPPMSSSQISELAYLLDRVATWSKIQDLEINLTSSSRKNSANDLQEPSAKKMKLNGTTINGRLIDSELCEELVDLSLSSGIPCILTGFRGDDLVQQIYPHKPAPSNTQTVKPNHSKKMDSYNQRRLAHIQKMHRRNQRYKRDSGPSQPMSVSSIAKNTLTAVGSTLRSVAGSFGLSIPSTVQQNGHRLEDQELYQNKRGSMLQWDETKGKLVYPAYYRTNGTTTQDKKTPYVHSKPQANGHSNESSSDDEDFISDTDSNSSLDPDWDELRKPSELRPLIQMQLYSGAWPMLRAFSYAVGVPLDEVRKLLDTGKGSTKTPQEDDENCNIWTTALAVACLELYFPQLRAEWEIVAFKGSLWLKENARKETDLSYEEVTSISKTLVSKWL